MASTRCRVEVAKRRGIAKGDAFPPSLGFGYKTALITVFEKPKYSPFRFYSPVWLEKTA